MMRHRSSVLSLPSVVFLVALTIGVPFIHLHPQVTHAAHLGEHTHAAVIHTFFSSEGSGNPTYSIDSIGTENSEEFSGVTIDWPLVPQRFSAPLGLGGTDAPIVSVISILPHPAKDIALRGDVAGVLLPSSWVGTPLSSRAPPFLPFLVISKTFQ